MRRKFYLLMLAVIFFALISGGCGGSGGGGGIGGTNTPAKRDYPEPYDGEIANFAGHWHIVSGEAIISYPNRNLNFTAKYVPFSPDVVFTFNVSENDDDEYSTIAIDGLAINADAQTGYRYITGAEFVNEKLSNDVYIKWLIDNLKTSQLVIGSSEYTKIDDNLYSMDIDENHSSVFTFTDPDTIIWEVRGNRGFYLVIKRYGDEIPVNSQVNGNWYISDGYIKVWNYGIEADYSKNSVPKFTISVTQTNGNNDDYIISPSGAPVYLNSINASFDANPADYSKDIQKTLAQIVNLMPVVIGYNDYAKYEPNNNGKFTPEDFYEYLTSIDDTLKIQGYSFDVVAANDDIYTFPKNPSEIYVRNISGGHDAVFWLESGKPDILYWQSIGYMNYHVEMTRR